MLHGQGVKNAVSDGLRMLTLSMEETTSAWNDTACMLSSRVRPVSAWAMRARPWCSCSADDSDPQPERVSLAVPRSGACAVSLEGACTMHQQQVEPPVYTWSVELEGCVGYDGSLHSDPSRQHHYAFSQLGHDQTHIPGSESSA